MTLLCSNGALFIGWWAGFCAGYIKTNKENKEQ